MLGRIAWIHHFESNAPACMRTLEAALAEFKKPLPGNERVQPVRAGLITLLGQVPRASLPGLIGASAFLLLQRLVLPLLHWLDDGRRFGTLRPRAARTKP